MERTVIADIGKMSGKNVLLKGWIYRTRSGKNISFVVLRDYSGTVQCVVKDDVKGFGDAQKALIESSVELKGKVKKDERAPTGYEVQVTDFRVVGFADDFPIKEQQSPELLLDWRHLWIRSQKLNKIFRIRSTILGAIHEYYRSSGFFEIQSPSITTMACEGGSTLFEMKYFGQKAFLTQSWQLHAEALASSLEKIYCIAPSFRSERSRTRHHLAEYWHAEAEVAWIDHEESLKIQEGLISHIVQTCIKRHRKDLEELGADIKMLEKVKTPFRRLPYSEVIDIMKKKGVKMKWGDDVTDLQLRALSEDFDKPYFIVNWPKESKPFYMLENPKDPKTVLNADCIAPGDSGGEIIGGSARETDPKKILAKLKAEGTDPANYGWYLDVRRFGSVPHAGYGMGVERLTQWICNVDHIRDCIAFPRTINRIYP
ncbi:MAG: asparagine--tRNA ligase [Candidatus Aenigmarchaeota archaeon]|nr:asparagine--tRNA ligase [Candidatus Aenigmarchaeota archaeon]